MTFWENFNFYCNYLAIWYKALLCIPIKNAKIRFLTNNKIVLLQYFLTAQN